MHADDLGLASEVKLAELKSQASPSASHRIVISVQASDADQDVSASPANHALIKTEEKLLPKVTVPFETRLGRPSRGIVLEQTRQLYASQSLEVRNRPHPNLHITAHCADAINADTQVYVAEEQRTVCCVSWTDSAASTRHQLLVSRSAARLRDW